MTEEAKKDSFKEPQEEFIGEGIARSKKEGENRSAFDDMTMEDLHDEAKKRGIENYLSMNRKELITNIVENKRDV